LLRGVLQLSLLAFLVKKYKYCDLGRAAARSALCMTEEEEEEESAVGCGSKYLAGAASFFAGDTCPSWYSPSPKCMRP
jgi:hypothetical protein